MPIIADLHLHSKYSRAVSQKMDLWEIAHFASLKGIDLVATVTGLTFLVKRN
jgi:PHP family Zn ribbon phosphoesterase